MASDKEFLEFIVDQIENAGQITFKMMFGEYGIWSDGKLFFHFDGAYHSDNFEGIVWWINKLKPGLNIKTISTVYQKDIEHLNEDNIDRANYIFAIPETMTKTKR